MSPNNTMEENFSWSIRSLTVVAKHSEYRRMEVVRGEEDGRKRGRERRKEGKVEGGGRREGRKERGSGGGE